MITMLLRVTAPHFVAGAIWVKDNRWKCVEAAPIIKWMIGKSPVEVQYYLNQRQWQYQWLHKKEEDNV